MAYIFPGILEQEWEKIEEKLTLVRPFAHTIHVDLLDGKFAPNTSFFDPLPFAAYKDIFFLELHMMVDDPAKHVAAFAQAGFKRFLGQIEMMPDQKVFVESVRKEDGEVGLAIDSPTPVEAITLPFDDVDSLFVMTVKAGFSNQSFLPVSLEKVALIRSKTTKPIEVDGGINDVTIKQAKEAGATRFVSTGFLFRDDPGQQYKILEGCLT